MNEGAIEGEIRLRPPRGDHPVEDIAPIGDQRRRVHGPHAIVGRARVTSAGWRDWGCAIIEIRTEPHAGLDARGGRGVPRPVAKEWNPAMIVQRYPEHFIAPMREELTVLGFEELRTPEAVDTAVARPGTTLLVVNSVCGCAAGKARPGIAMALDGAVKPAHLTTVFAGGDVEATAQARAHLAPYPPSSPSIALLKDGKVAFMMERRDIEGRPAERIAQVLAEAFDQHC